MKKVIYILFVLFILLVPKKAKSDEINKGSSYFFSAGGPHFDNLLPLGFNVDLNTKLVGLSIDDDNIFDLCISFGIPINLFQPYARAGITSYIGKKKYFEIGVFFLKDFSKKKLYDFRFSNELLSLNLGFRAYINDNNYVGFSFNPTFSIEEKPLYIATLIIGYDF